MKKEILKTVIVLVVCFGLYGYSAYSNRTEMEFISSKIEAQNGKISDIEKTVFYAMSEFGIRLSRRHL